MRGLLKRLFPNVWELTHDWEPEKWMMLPLALVFLMAPISAIVHSILLSLGWIHETIVGGG